MTVAADRPAEEEADHEGDQRTHDPMLGRPSAARPDVPGVTAPVRVSVHLRVGAPFTDVRGTRRTSPTLGRTLRRGPTP